MRGELKGRGEEKEGRRGGGRRGDRWLGLVDLCVSVYVSECVNVCMFLCVCLSVCVYVCCVYVVCFMDWIG